VRNATIARNYAEALFELGGAHGETGAYVEAFDRLAGLLAEDRILRFLETPKIEGSAKQAAVRAALEGRVPERFLRFVLVVIAKRRQGLLEEIGQEYRDLVDEDAGQIHAEVTLAREPDEATRTLIAERLSEVLGKTVIPHITVNPDILGGLVVRYGDRAMDASLRRQLVSLKRDMLNATLPELPASA
jgi:F-type H+-transporting ATPase subunit delta